MPIADLLQTQAGKIALAIAVIVAIFLIYHFFIKEGLSAMPDNSNMLFGIVPRKELDSTARRTF